VVGVPVALPGCVWRPPQAQGVRLGVQRRPLDAMEDEAGAILKLPLLRRGGSRRGGDGDPVASRISPSARRKAALRISAGLRGPAWPCASPPPARPRRLCASSRRRLCWSTAPCGPASVHLLCWSGSSCDPCKTAMAR